MTPTPPFNSITIGCLQLQSNNKTMDDLIGIALSILQDKTFQQHLNQIKLSELSGSASYTG